ncbi:NADH dehydrogenase subunit L [Yersinia enterocolitica]|nr:NADH dehydrogenase subunit L [Yersinia enterocolitica]
MFHGEPKTKAHQVKGITHSLPLIVLLVLSTFVGALITPPLAGVLPELHFGEEGKMPLEIFSGVLVVMGIALAAMLYLGKRQLVNSIAQSAPGRFFTVWWFHAWGFDWLYHNVFVRPYLWIARLLQRDPLNSLMNTPAILSRWSNRGLTVSENGQVRWYVASMGLGAVVVLALLLFV